MPALLLFLALSLGLPQGEVRFGGWRVLGPLEAKGSLGEVLPPEKALGALRLDAEGPDPEKDHRKYGGGKVRWVDLGLDPEAHVDLGKRYGTLTDACAYLHREIDADVACRVPILLGSDDGLTLWLNGEEVLYAPESRGHLQGEQRLFLNLGAGKNHLVAKVYNVGGAWGFSSQTHPDTLAGTEEDLLERIDEAIDRGVSNLLSRQHLDGSFGHQAASYPNGHTALALYTLLHCGVPRRHHAVRRATAFLRARSPVKTYSAACQLMAFAELRDPALLPEIEGIAEELLDWERNGYAYPAGEQDLSNTQYAALGLRAAHSAGVDIPDAAWRDLVTSADRFEAREGGFSYRPNSGATGSMTVAGMTVHALARERLGDRIPSRERNLSTRGIEQGLAWIEANFSVYRNTKAADGKDAGWNYYYLYGVERVAGYLGLDTVRERDWYWEGAQRLLHLQTKEGNWPGEPNTCFALLFLRRATKASLSGEESKTRAETYGDDDPARAVSMRASGDTPTSLWISSFGDDIREKYQWPVEGGDDLRVRSVTYLLDGEPLETVPGDPDLPAGTQRWPYPLRRDDVGQHRIQARVTLVAPDGADVVLESNVVEVSIDEAPAVELVSYAGQRDANLLLGKRVKLSGSSQRNGSWTPGRATDGLLSTGWLSTPEDASPSLELSLSRPVRAGSLALTPAVENRQTPERTALASRVAIYVNKRKTPILLDVPPRLDRKLMVPFEKPENVRHVVIEILAREGEPTRPVGWMEVELLP